MTDQSAKFPKMSFFRTRLFKLSWTAIPFGLICGFLAALSIGGNSIASEDTPLGLYDLVGNRVENPEIGVVGFVHDAIIDEDGAITSLILVRGLGQSPNPISFHQIAFSDIEVLVNAKGERQLHTTQTHEMLETEPTFVYTVLPGEPATDIITLAKSEQSLRAAMFQNVCTSGDDIIGSISHISSHADGTNVNFEVSFEALGTSARIAANRLTWEKTGGCYVPNSEQPATVG